MATFLCILYLVTVSLKFATAVGGADDAKQAFMERLKTMNYLVNPEVKFEEFFGTRELPNGQRVVPVVVQVEVKDSEAAAYGKLADRIKIMSDFNISTVLNHDLVSKAIARYGRVAQDGCWSSTTYDRLTFSCFVLSERTAILARLGLPETATSEEVNVAYHALAKQYHPDKNPGSEEKFKKINAAKKAFDRLEIREKEEKKSIKLPSFKPKVPPTHSSKVSQLYITQ